jgi:hypothetical protein
LKLFYKLKTLFEFKMSSVNQSKINPVTDTSTSPNKTPKIEQSDLKYKEKVIYKNRFGPNLFRISTSYLLIVAVGITTFYFAKKEVDQHRQQAMIVKKEIAENSKMYPNRGEIIKNERAEQLKKQQQQ